MAVITFATSKGGAGKTTTAAAIGSELALRGTRVVFVDADPNLHLKAWHDHGAMPATRLYEANGEDVLDVIDRAAGEGDHVIVDLEGAASQLVLQAVMKSDLVVIPTQLSNLDLREAHATRQVVRRADRLRGAPIRCAYVVTRMPPLRSRLAGHLEGELLDPADEGAVRLPGLQDRVAWREMMNHGVPPQLAGAEPGPKAAAGDAARLADGVLALLAPQAGARR